MIDAPKSDFLVPFDGSFKVKKSPTDSPKDGPSKKKLEKKLADLVEEMRDLQSKLYADDKYALLLVFQALDAAGKDGTVNAVMSGVNPAGCQVFSFKQPSPEELDHEFLWRTARCLPERGRIGIFNRSYYEEVIVVKVHPEYLVGEKLPKPPPHKKLWEERYDSIREHERHLARNGVVVLKFWLNVSKDEQKRRLLARIDDPSRNWKFSKQDLIEREHWDNYMSAYEAALNGTSREWAPWYAIPADDKPFMRYEVARIMVEALRSMDLCYPKLSDMQRQDLLTLRHALERQE